MAREKVTIRERRSGKSEEEPTEQPEVKSPETKKVHEGDSLLFSNEPSPKSSPSSFESKKTAEPVVKELHTKNDEPQTPAVKQANEELLKKYVHKTDDGYLQIKLPPRFMIERVIYIAVILVLIYMLIFNPFGQKSFTLNITMPSLPNMANKNITEATQNPVVEVPEEPVTGTTPETPITQPVVIKPSTPNTTTTTTNGSCSASGKPSIEIKDIDMDSEKKNKVNTITVKITNNGNTALTNFKLDVNWYTQDNKEDTMYFKRLRSAASSNTLGFYPFTTENVKACGGVSTITLDDQIISRYITAGEKNTVRVRLLDSGGERELAQATIDVTPEE